MAGSTQQAFAAGASVASGVAHDAGAHRQQMTLGIGANGIGQGHGMALDVMLGGLLAGENRLDRALQQMRRQRSLRLDGELFLAAEGAAAGRQLDLDLLLRQVQHAGDLALVEDRALALAVHLDAASLRQRQTGFGLQEGNVDALSGEGLLDDVRGRGQRALHIAARERRGLNQVRGLVDTAGGMHLGRAGLHGFERVGERRQHLVIDLDAGGGLAGMEGGVGHDHGEEVTDAAGGFADGHEDGKIGNDESGAALCRGIGGGQDADDAGHGRGFGGVQGQDLGPRVLA